MKMKHKREFKKYSICPFCGGKDKKCGYCHGKFFVLVERTVETDVSDESILPQGRRPHLQPQGP